MHTEWGPDAAGATFGTSPHGDPGGARRRPRLRYSGVKPATPFADSSEDPMARGLTAITPAASEIAAAAAEDCRLRRGIVRVPGLPEDSGSGPDEHERPAAVSLDLAQECTRRQERRRQVRVDGCAPPLECQLPHRDVLRRPDACDGRT